MSAAHCSICLNNFPLSKAARTDYKIFPCGHGCCTECSERLFVSNRLTCPHCRVSVHRRDAHPIFIEIIDEQTLLQTAVVEGLDMMGPDTPLVSVKKASQKLGNALRGAGVKQENSGMMAALLQAAEDFKDRITPLFAKVNDQKEEIDALKNDLRKLRRDKDTLQSKLRKTESLQAEVKRLQTVLSDTETNNMDILRVAEMAQGEAAAQKTIANQWKKRAAELEQDNRRLIDQRERQKTDKNTLVIKSQKLTKQVATLTEKLQAAEEKNRISDVAHEYDGDESTHEQSRIHLESSLRISSATPSRSHRHPDENNAELDFGGIPPRNFPSEWQLPGVLKKRNLNGNLVGGHRRPGYSSPIELNGSGQPTRAVQLGPKRTVRVR